MLGGGEARADRQPATEPLGQRHRVRPRVRLLPGPQRAGPPHAALDLVEHEQCTALVACSARRAEHLVGHRVDAGLSLDGLDQNRGGALSDCSEQGVGVLAGDGHKPWHERREWLLFRLLRGGGERPHRAAVEGAAEHHELPAPAPLARQLDRALDRLGAGVREEHLSAQRPLREPSRKTHCRLRVEEVAHLHQAPRLLAHRVHQRRVAVPDLDNRHAREEIEVFAPLRVPQPRALATDELDWRARVRRHHELALERLQLRERHGKILVPMPASVKSSSRREWDSRPSMMCAAVTPLRTACAHAASFGRIPPVT